MSQVLLRLPAVQAREAVCRSSMYQRIAQGLYTKPIALGARAVGWPETEVACLVAARIAGQTDDQIRSLVARLEAARKFAPTRLVKSLETESVA